MIERWAVGLGLVTIAGLDILLWLHVTQRRGNGALDTVLLIVALLLVLSSSVVLAVAFRRRGRQVLAAAFALNIVLLVASTAIFQLHLVTLRVAFDVAAGLIIYWLNQYLFALTRGGSDLWRVPAATGQRAHVDAGDPTAIRT